MTTTRRTLLAATALAASLPAFAQTASTGSGQAYPDKPITVIVPQAPGGANDAIARIVVQKMGELMNANFVVENRTGAGGNVGTAAAAKARPDGYTLMLTADSAYVINPSLYKSVGFDPLKDFEPITPVANAGYVVVANNGFPARNIAELIAQAKQKPGGIMIGSAGNGTLNHLVGEMLNKAAGIQLVHVPYKGAAAAVTDLASGQVQVSVQSLPSSISFIKSGRIKVLGTVNEKRVAALPDVPTIGETIPGFGYTPWYGLFAPAGTPKPILAQLHAAVAKALDDPTVKEKLAGVGTEPYRSSPEEFAAMIRREIPRWAQVVKDSGAKVD
jgi:tripartite-type tricarboxylate transporter receptor subunit TctC